MVLLCSVCAPGSAYAQTRHSSTSIATNFERQVLNAVDAGEGDYETRTLRARLTADPGNLQIRLELARRYQKSGFPEVAIEHGRLACERSPESAEAHLMLAKLLREEHRPGEASAVLNGFAISHPGDVEVWAWLGVVADEARDWKTGEAAHRKAIAMAPGRADLLNNLGYCLLEQKRLQEAVATFQAVLVLDPKSRIARNNLGLALADKPAEALQNWQAVEGPASAHNNMAVTLIEAGHYAEARHEIQQALGYDGQHSAALNNLRILSELDNRPAEILARLNPVGRRSKFAALWHRRRTNDSTTGEKNNPGNPAASSRQGTN